MSIFDFHVDLMLNLHLISNNFQILNLKFSLEQVPSGDTYHSKKWRQEPVLCQAASLEVMLVRHRNNIEKTMWKTHQCFIDFESQMDIELSTANQYLFPKDLPFIINELLPDFWHGISMLNQWWIDKDVSIG